MYKIEMSAWKRQSRLFLPGNRREDMLHLENETMQLENLQKTMLHLENGRVDQKMAKHHLTC